MRKPLGCLEVLLLQGSIQHPESPYLARRGRVVALYVCFGFAVRRLQGKRASGLCKIISLGKRKKRSVLCLLSTNLLLVVQTLVVVLENGHAFGFAGVVLGVCVGHVAREDFLPEGEAARGAWVGCVSLGFEGGLWGAFGGCGAAWWRLRAHAGGVGWLAMSESVL